MYVWKIMELKGWGDEGVQVEGRRGGSSTAGLVGGVVINTYLPMISCMKRKQELGMSWSGIEICNSSVGVFPLFLCFFFLGCWGRGAFWLGGWDEMR
jgi:hypothetical protein